MKSSPADFVSLRSIFAGFAALEDDDSDDGLSDDDEDDGEDPAAEIDLGDSEDDLPKKKRQRN